MPHFERGGPVNYMIAGAGCSVAGRPGVTAAARAGGTGPEAVPGPRCPRPSRPVVRDVPQPTQGAMGCLRLVHVL